MRALITPHRTRVLGIAGAACVLAGYFVYQLAPVLRAPRVELRNLKENTVVADPRFTLRGTATKDVRLTMNREPLYVDQDGNFSQEIYLASGVNLIEITAEGKFGRKAIITRNIVYRKLPIPKEQ